MKLSVCVLNNDFIAKAEKTSIVANISYNSDDADSNAAYVMMEVDHKKKIKEISDEFDEMIKFMDTSFEKAFDKKEKDFMLAYRVSMNRTLIDLDAPYVNSRRDRDTEK